MKRKRTLLFVLLLLFALSMIGCAELDDENKEKEAGKDTKAVTEAVTSTETPAENVERGMPTDSDPGDETDTPSPTESVTDAPTDTPSPVPTDTPTPSPTPTEVPIPPYTTNTADKAPEGKEGFYCYVNKDDGYDEYLIVNFDDNLFYVFDHYPKNASENFGMCLLITEGNLNSGLSVKGYFPDGEANLSCKFKKQKDAETLVVTDIDGSKTDYSATDLLAALELVENFDLYDLTDPANVSRNAEPERNYTGKLDLYDDEFVYYVVNINTYKFHYPNCRHVSRMYAENTNYATENGFPDYETAREWLINHGFSPCGTCCP